MFTTFAPMQTTDTQEVTVDAPRDLIAAALRGQASAPVAQPAAPAVVTNVEVAPQDTVTEEVPVAQAAAEQVAQAVKAETPATESTPAEAPVDPYAAVAEGLSTPAAPATWDDSAKAVFAKEFGTDDYSAVKTQIEQLNIVKGEYEKVKPVLDQFNSLPPTILEPLRLAMQGKIQEAQDYLKNTPSAVIAALEPEKMDDKSLIGAHFPGKVSAEQWEMLNDPEADPDVVDALKLRIGILRDAAADKQRAGVEAARNAQHAQKEAEKAAYENFERGVAATVSAAKSSPLKGLVDHGTVDQIRSGAFLREFVQEDGVTPTPQAATLLLWARHGQKISEAAEARGYARGRTDAGLEASSRQPSRPFTGARSAGDSPTPITPDDQVRNLMYAALKNN